MAKQLINLGTVNGRDGDTVRSAFNKINDNFSELYVGLDLSNIGTNVRPATSALYDLGGVDRVWHALWLSPEGVHIGNSLLSVNDQGAVTVDGEVVATPNGDPIQADWLATSGPSKILNKPTLSAVATSNDYRQLSHKPTIPTQTSQLTNDAGFSTFSGSWIDLTNKPTLFNGSYLSLTNRPSLFSGSYLDLSHKPTLFSGDYNDLINTPTIPLDVNQLTDVDSLLGSGGGTVDTSPYTFDSSGISWTSPDEPPDPIGGWFANAIICMVANTGTVISNGIGGLGSQAWLFGADSKLHLPPGGTIVDSNGTNILDGLSGGSGLSISDFGRGFTNSLDSGKITTSKLYNRPANLALNNHFELSVDDGGIIHLPDQSVINGATLKSVAGNYAGITAGPVGKDEDSWMWVEPNGAFIATDYSTNAYQWQFTNDGKLQLPVGGTIVDSDGVNILDGLGGNGSTTWSSITDINNNYGPQKLAIGYGAGEVNQGTITLALGYYAGHTGQGNYAVAIGQSAGQVDQGANAIAIGALAGQVSQPANSIILNASGSMTIPTSAGFFVNPVRNVTGGVVPSGFYPTYYNPTTGEFIVVTP